MRVARALKTSGGIARPALAAALALALLVAGCGHGSSFTGNGDNIVIAPDAGEGNGSEAPAPPSADGTSAPTIVPDPSDEQVTLTLFYQSSTGLLGPWPWRRTIDRPDRTADLARAALENLLNPPPDSPFVSALPQGTRVLSVEVDESQQIAYANFSSELISKHPGGSNGEGVTVQAIVLTLTGIPGIRQVQILVEGKIVDSVAGHVAVDRPLERMLVVPGMPDPAATTAGGQGGRTAAREGSPWSMEGDDLVLDYFQEQVDRGRMQWLTDPLEAARYLTTAFGFFGWDEFVLLHRSERGEGSGLAEALVRVRHRDAYYTVHMIQPRRQGDKGIWVVRDIRSRAILAGRKPVNEKLAQAWQEEVDGGNNLWRLDPVESVRRNGGLYGFDRFSDEFSLIDIDRDAGRARVRVEHDGRAYEVRLTQPVRRGERGVWWIDFIAPEEDRSQP